MISLNAVPWRLIGYGLAAIAVLALALRVQAWRDAYEELPTVKEALEAETLCGEGSQCLIRQQKLEEEQAKKTAEVVADYERELEELRNRPIPRRVIRVCNGGGVPNAGAATGTGTGASGEGMVQRPDEFDTRPLRELALRADEVTAQCRQLIRWNVALSKTNGSD